jgi:hypothetical protein
MGDQGQQHFADRGVAGDFGQRPEGEGVVGDDQFDPLGDRLLDDLGGHGQADHDRANRTLAIADQQADIVPGLGKCQGGNVGQDLANAIDPDHFGAIMQIIRRPCC